MKVYFLFCEKCEFSKQFVFLSFNCKKPVEFAVANINSYLYMYLYIILISVQYSNFILLSFILGHISHLKQSILWNLWPCHLGPNGRGQICTQNQTTFSTHSTPTHVVMASVKPSTKLLKFMAHSLGVQALGQRQFVSYCCLSIYYTCSTQITCHRQCPWASCLIKESRIYS